MFQVSRVFGGLLVLAVLWHVGTGMGGIGLFFDPASMVMVVTLSLGGVLIAHGWGGVRQVFKRGGDCKLAVGVLTAAHQFTWGAGLLCTFLVLIGLMQNMSDPTKIGPGMAAGLLPLLYAAVLAEFIIFPIRCAKAAGTEPTDTTPSRLVAMPLIAAASLVMVLCLWGILTATATH